MGYIKNRDQLLQTGDKESREKILRILEAVWREVNAYDIIRGMMRIEGETLIIGEKSWDLKKKRKLYLFGAGKACNAMAMAVEEVLGDKLDEGIISVKIAEPQDHYRRIKAYVGGHPLPNAEGMKAAQEIIQMIDQATEDDLFLSVISGGSSALLTCPVDGISLEDEILAQDMLLRSGAKILEINAVRRHISKTNGGRLAERVRKRGAELINIIVSDAVGAMPTINRHRPVMYSGTPIAPDETTIMDARSCICNYALQSTMPKTIVDYLWSGEEQIETPKEFDEQVTHFVLNDVPDSCEAAIKAAEGMGIPSMVYSTFLEGESCEAGIFFGTLAREIQANSRPIKAPCFVFSSGETTTKVEDESTGRGGPGHEMALGFALEARYTNGAALASVDTEGTDGTTKYAGGLADSQTFKQLEEAGIDIYKTLRNHAAGDALESIYGSIFTGNTGTNLCDFNIMYVPAVK